MSSRLIQLRYLYTLNGKLEYENILTHEEISKEFLDSQIYPREEISKIFIDVGKFIHVSYYHGAKIIDTTRFTKSLTKFVYKYKPKDKNLLYTFTSNQAPIHFLSPYIRL